jgi:hypothetical protein
MTGKRIPARSRSGAVASARNCLSSLESLSQPLQCGFDQVRVLDQLRLEVFADRDPDLLAFGYDLHF